MTDNTLTTTDHSRDSAQLRYVYAVLSRRAQGLSIGINLNTNNACNWRCIYCQVPELSRGAPPPLDMALLEQELRGFLGRVLHGDFMQQRLPEGMRRIVDIAISGNGEPTSAQEFAAVIDLVCRVKEELGVPEVKLVLITNGSLMQREGVQQGLRRMAQANGAVWFKLDRGSEEGMKRVNDTQMTMERVRENLRTALSCCPNTWLQTCWFALDGEAPDRGQQKEFVDFIDSLLSHGVRPRGVLLYSLARPSLQPEAPRLSALTAEQLEAFAAQIRALGLPVQVAS